MEDRQKERFPKEEPKKQWEPKNERMEGVREGRIQWNFAITYLAGLKFSALYPISCGTS